MFQMVELPRNHLIVIRHSAVQLLDTGRRRFRDRRTIDNSHDTEQAAGLPLSDSQAPIADGVTTPQAIAVSGWRPDLGWEWEST